MRRHARIHVRGEVEIEDINSANGVVLGGTRINRSTVRAEDVVQLGDTRLSVIPLGFWYCSLGGGVVLLAYALYVGDAVFIVGQASGLFVYSRNLYLIFRERAALRAAAEHPVG